MPINVSGNSSSLYDNGNKIDRWSWGGHHLAIIS